MRKSYPLVVGGAPMAYAKGVLGEGRFVFLSGVLDAHGALSEQVPAVWDTIKARLEELGSRCENIVQRMTFVTDIAAWRAEGSPAQTAWLQHHAPSLLNEQPAGTLVQIVALAQPGAMVEIQVVAVAEA